MVCAYASVSAVFLCFCDLSAFEQADPPTNGGGASAGDEAASCLLDAPIPDRRLLKLLEQVLYIYRICVYIVCV